MAVFVANSDFTGRYVIARNTLVNEQVNEIVNQFEEYYLNRVLGVSLATALIEDSASGTPTDPDLLELFEPFSMQDNCTNEVYQSFGIKQMLKGFLYFEIIKERKEVPALTGGNVEPENENSNLILGDKLFDFYNEAVRTARAIQYKCMQESEKYPNFKGMKIYYASKF